MFGFLSNPMKSDNQNQDSGPSGAGDNVTNVSIIDSIPIYTRTEIIGRPVRVEIISSVPIQMEYGGIGRMLVSAVGHGLAEALKTNIKDLGVSAFRGVTGIGETKETNVASSLSKDIYQYIKSGKLAEDAKNTPVVGYAVDKATPVVTYAIDKVTGAWAVIGEEFKSSVETFGNYVNNKYDYSHGKGMKGAGTDTDPIIFEEILKAKLWTDEKKTSSKDDTDPTIKKKTSSKDEGLLPKFFRSLGIIGNPPDEEKSVVGSSVRGAKRVIQGAGSGFGKVLKGSVKGAWKVAGLVKKGVSKGGGLISKGLNAGGLVGELTEIGLGLGLMATGIGAVVVVIKAFTSLTDLIQGMIGAAVKITETMINASGAIAAAVAPFQQQVASYNPGIIDRFQLALLNLSAALGRIFEPIFDIAIKLADEFNEIVTALASEFRPAVREAAKFAAEFSKGLLEATIPFVREFMAVLEPVAKAFNYLNDILVTLFGPSFTLVSISVALLATAFGVLAIFIGAAVLPVFVLLGLIVAPVIAGFFALKAILEAFGYSVSNMTGSFLELGTGLRTTAAHPATLTSLEGIGEQARISAFSQGYSVQEEQLQETQQTNFVLTAIWNFLKGATLGPGVPIASLYS